MKLSIEVANPNTVLDNLQQVAQFANRAINAIYSKEQKLEVTMSDVPTLAWLRLLCGNLETELGAGFIKGDDVGEAQTLEEARIGGRVCDIHMDEAMTIRTGKCKTEGNAV